MLETIEEETNIKIRLINMPITLIGIDIARRCSMESDIDYIYHLTHLEMNKMRNYEEKLNQVIVTLCHTGEGGAIQLKRYIDQYSKLNMKTIPLAISAKDELIHEVSELKNQLDTLSLQLKDLNERHSSLDAEILLKESADDEIKKKMFVLDNEINSLQSQLLESMSEVSRLETSKIEVDQKRKHALQSQNSDDIKKKLDNLKAILTDLIEEYNDRVERLKTTEKSLEDLSQEQTVLTSKINHKHQSINDLNQEITKNKNRQEILVDLVENKSNYHHGVKAIMELAHDNPDIIGVFGDLLENDSKYDLAVSVALGSALQFIVTKDNLQARLAIKFLKDNKAGRATFLPLADMEPRSLREEHAI